MIWNRFAVALEILLAGSLASTRVLEASGAILYEFGTPDVGLAAAGWASRGDDASTLFKNPAGMSFLPKSELQLTAQLLYGDLGFDSDSNTSVSGNDGGNPIGFFPASGLFYVHKLPLDLSAGIGLFSYFGLAQNFDNDWVGRYYIQEATLLGLTIMPSLSYQPFEWLSIGAGLNAMLGVYSLETAVNTGPLLDDGSLSLEDSTWGFGADLGILLEPRKGTRLGVSYLSPVSLDFEDRRDFSGLGPVLEGALGAAGLLNSSLDIGLTVPQQVMVSASQQLGEKWTVMANIGWQDWSDFGKVEVTVNSDTPTDLTFDRNYQDTFHGAIGVQYRMLEDWFLTLGFAYDSSPVKDSDRTVDFAVGETYRFGLGVLWQATEDLLLGGAYEFGWIGDMPVDQGDSSQLTGRVSGEFSDSALHIFALNLSWRL